MWEFVIKSTARKLGVFFCIWEIYDEKFEPTTKYKCLYYYNPFYMVTIDTFLYIVTQLRGICLFYVSISFIKEDITLLSLA